MLMHNIHKKALNSPLLSDTDTEHFVKKKEIHKYCKKNKYQSDWMYAPTRLNNRSHRETKKKGLI